MLEVVRARPFSGWPYRPGGDTHVLERALGNHRDGRTFCMFAWVPLIRLVFSRACKFCPDGIAAHSSVTQNVQRKVVRLNQVEHRPSPVDMLTRL